MHDDEEKPKKTDPEPHEHQRQEGERIGYDLPGKQAHEQQSADCQDNEDQHREDQCTASRFRLGQREIG